MAVLGGRNIGDDYFGIDPELDFRDLDVLAVGPVAKQAGAAFDEYWNSPASVPIDALLKKPIGADELNKLRRDLEASLDELDAIPYTVPVAFDETVETLKKLAEDLVWAEVEVIADSLDRFQGGSESAFVELTDELTRSAERDVVIETAYLIPSKEGIAKVAEMTDRGVRVRILTNSLQSTNHTTVHSHYMKWRKRLIEAGVELNSQHNAPRFPPKKIICEQGNKNVF